MRAPQHNACARFASLGGSGEATGDLAHARFAAVQTQKSKQ